MLACVFQMHKFQVITKEQYDKKDRESLLKFPSPAKVLFVTCIHVHVHVCANAPSIIKSVPVKTIFVFRLLFTFAFVFICMYCISAL